MLKILFSIARWLVLFACLGVILSRYPEGLWLPACVTVVLAFGLRLFFRRPNSAAMVPAAAAIFGYTVCVIFDRYLILQQVSIGIFDRNHAPGLVDGLMYKSNAMAALSCISVLSMLAVWMLVKPNAVAQIFAILISGLFIVKYVIEMSELHMWDRGPMTNDIMFLLMIFTLLLLGGVGQLLNGKEDERKI